jgi:hypothetical protein
MIKMTLTNKKLFQAIGKEGSQKDEEGHWKMV